VFKRQADERVEKSQKQWLTTLLMTGEPVDQRQIDYERGYWFAVRQLIGGPERALKAMERSESVGS
jgi:hypothetical protein